MIDWYLLLAAFASFFLAACGVGGKVNLVPIGLALWVLSLLV